MRQQLHLKPVLVKHEPCPTWEAQLRQTKKINVLWNCNILSVRCFPLHIEAFDIFNLWSFFLLSERPAFTFIQAVTSIHHLGVISADKWRHKYRKHFGVKGRKTFGFPLSTLLN